MKNVHIFLAMFLLGNAPAHAMSPEQCREAGISQGDIAFGACLAAQNLIIGAKLSPEMRMCHKAGYRGAALGRCVISLLNREEPGTAWTGPSAVGDALQGLEELNSSGLENARYRDSQGFLQSYERKCSGPCCESRCVD